MGKKRKIIAYPQKYGRKYKYLAPSEPVEAPEPEPVVEQAPEPAPAPAPKAPAPARSTRAKRAVKPRTSRAAKTETTETE